MAIKRRMKDGTIKYVTFKPEDKDVRIKRLEALLKDLTETLTEVMGYDKPIAAASTYSCYG
jgi:UDP-glucose 6-dehydrogenase